MKRLVNAYILVDMKKYIKDFNPDDYKPTMLEPTDPSVIEYVRNYYDHHLPVDLAAWLRVNKPGNNLIYGKHLFEQVLFINETLCRLLFPTVEEKTKNSPMVISTHVSCAVTLPVYRINIAKYGVEITLKNDFNNWKVSINSDIPINFDVNGIIFDPDYLVPSNHCYDIPPENIYGSYNREHSQFICKISSDYDLYTFMFLLKRFLEKKKK